MTTTVAKQLAKHSFATAVAPRSACWSVWNRAHALQLRVRRRPGGGGGHG